MSEVDYASSVAAASAFGAKLSEVEEHWKARQPSFVEHGYSLRPRFRPGWEPSWRRDPTIYFLDAEDYWSTHMLRPHLLDARRLSDNKLVLLKRIKRDSTELAIANYLSSEELRHDPRNHCVPVLDVIPDVKDDSFCYMVMPFFRYIDDPPLETVDNMLDCCEQLFEGLSFLHEHGVAHRDCAYKNIMLDAEPLYPKGFHPITSVSLPDDVTVSAPKLSRKNVPVKYYYIDFGISTRFEPDEPHKLVTGTDGIEQLVPELSNDVPYDPFKVDVFVLGRMLYETFFQKYANVDMIAPLVYDMVDPDPAKRPSAEDVLRRFQEIRRGVSALQAPWRLRPRDEPLVVTAVLETVSLVTAAFKSVF